MTSHAVHAALPLAIAVMVTSVCGLPNIIPEIILERDIEPRSLSGFGTSNIWKVQNNQEKHLDSVAYPNWDLDWSRRIRPTYRMSDKIVSNHVSSTSNSYSGIPSPANVYSDLYGRRGHKPTYYSSSPKASRAKIAEVPVEYSRFFSHSTPKARNIYKFAADKFEPGTTSSASNGDNLSLFSRNLNHLAAKLAKKLEGAESKNKQFNTDDLYTLATAIDYTDEIDIGIPTQAAAEVEVSTSLPTDLSTLKDLYYSNYLLLPTAAPLTMADQVTLQKNDMSSTSEMINSELYSRRHNEPRMEENSAHTSSNMKLGNTYDHILLRDLIDISKIMKKTLRRADGGENMEGGKSFAEQNGQINVSQEDTQISENVEPSNKSRKKGTKIQGSKLSNTPSLSYDNSLANLMSLPKINMDNTNRKTDYPNLTVIGKQIAAMNRRGTVENGDSTATDEDMETVTIPTTDRISNELNNNQIEVVENNNNAKEDEDTNSSESNEKNDQQAQFKDIQELDYLTEPRWSQATKNLYKQLIQGQNNPGASYQVPTLSAVNYGTNVPGSAGATIPYVQKYPGWRNKDYHQYSDLDPATGTYKFGYGGPYQWRHEERRADGVTYGGYGWLDEAGEHHVTRFIADAAGYRVLEPGQQIDFNVLPVYPIIPNKENDGGSINSYQNFNTPRPLVSRPSTINFPTSSVGNKNTTGAQSSRYPNLQIPGYVSPTTVKETATYSGNHPFISTPSLATKSPPVAASSLISPSVLNNLYQQVTQQYQGSQTSPEFYIGSKPLESSNLLGFPTQTFHTNNPRFPSFESLNITPDKNRPHLPFEYRGPIVDDYSSSTNLVTTKVDKNKVNPISNNIGQLSPQKGKPIATGLPTISYPGATIPTSPVNGAEQQNSATTDSSNMSSTLPDHWKSSVLKIQKPTKSQSLDYAFLTDDDPNLGSKGNSFETFTDLGDFFMSLLKNGEGLPLPNIVNQGDSKDEVKTRNKADRKAIRSDTSSERTNPNYIRHELEDKNETVGDYIGTVKWKIPVLGALDGYHNYGPLEVTKGGNLLPILSPAEHKNEQKNKLTKLPEHKLPETSVKKWTKIDEEVGISQTRRPPPPPPANFFTELLRHLLEARPDPNYRSSIQ